MIGRRHYRNADLHKGLGAWRGAWTAHYGEQRVRRLYEESVP